MLPFLNHLSMLPASPRRRKVPKKPFFKGWDDFMDFDNGFKHKMPVTQSEFALLLEKDGDVRSCGTLQGG